MPESLPEFLVAQRLRARSLGDHIVTFATLLADRGYATSTTKELLRLVADLGHWLGHRQRRAEDLDEKGVGQFLRVRLFCATRNRLGDEAEVATASDLRRQDGGRWRAGVQVGVIPKILRALVESPVGVEVAAGAERAEP